MRRRYFGTDGMRGAANAFPITPDVVLRLALAAGRHFRDDARHRDHHHKVVIGKDTRLSGYMLEPALVAGFVAAGMDVYLVGPMPTPAVAMLTRSMRCDLGVMISASHNPYRDNGVKLFGPDGYKLSDDEEVAIETLMDDSSTAALVDSDRLGRAKRLDDAPGRYIEFAKQSFPSDLRLDGLKIAIDCANGAAYHIAPVVLRELGADVIPIAVTPNGVNINHACGATAPETLRQTVIAHGADVGLALDGDADRLLVCDESGSLLDGDQVMALVASWYGERGLLRGPVVTTEMSNLSLETHLRQRGIALLRAAVGDRHVMAAMRTHDSNLGGEQSGHIILRDHATTGDGLIAALQVLAILVTRGGPLSRIGKVFDPAPQVLRNVSYLGNRPRLDTGVVADAIAAAAARLGNTGGRLLIRQSGTESVIRIMAQGNDGALVARVVDSIETALRCALTAPR